MTTFFWVLLATLLFIGGQMLLLRPSTRERELAALREAAKKEGFHPQVIPVPDWLRQIKSGMIACYSLPLPVRQKLQWRAAREADGHWVTLHGDEAVLSRLSLADDFDTVFAIEVSDNILYLYWTEQRGPEFLPQLKKLATQCVPPTLNS